ncbi:hypothetical protein GF325_17810 [Candidatus Bathyarchaeota archaeon]|nr:hypothetical protein [Candidatus Bathyarchaeota archaeon]
MTCAPEDHGHGGKRVFTFMFIGSGRPLLERFFSNFFDGNISLSPGRQLFYYPFNLEEHHVLIKAFAVQRASLEHIVTPPEFSTTDCVCIIVDLDDASTFAKFIPYLQAILEKKHCCPPILLIGLHGGSFDARKVPYIGMIALKNYLGKHFTPPDIHYVEWNPGGTFDGKRVITEVIIEMLKPINSFHNGSGKRISGVRIKSVFKSLKRHLPGYLSLNIPRGLKYLIADEAYRRVTREFANHGFHGYTRKHFVERGVDPAVAKRVLDAWEQPEGDQETGWEDIDTMAESVPGLKARLAKYYQPLNLNQLLQDFEMTLVDAKRLVHSLNLRHVNADYHDTHYLIEELMGILEVFVLYEGQPIFSHLPNKSRGFGSLENVSLISGMIQVLDILRSQVFISDLDAVQTVEKIRYGALNLCIAHGTMVKVILHSIRELSKDIMNRVARFVSIFENHFQSELTHFKGDLDAFSKQGVQLYHDTFTPLPLNQVNMKWTLRDIPSTLNKNLTRRQITILEGITTLIHSGQIPDPFPLEDLLPLVSRKTAISLSDLLLLLPGEILELVK